MEAFPPHLFQLLMHMRSTHNSGNTAVNTQSISRDSGDIAINEINNLRVKEYEEEKQKEPIRIIQEPLLLDGYIRDMQQTLLTQTIPVIINSIVHRFYRAPPVAPHSLSSYFPIKRLKTEIEDINLPNECSVGLIGNNLFKWRVIMLGPEGSPYYGGIFCLTAIFPDEYPFKPPLIQFDTKIYHCNISSSGRISLDILQDSWSPALSLAKILLSIRSLLLAPDADNPQVLNIATLYKTDRKKHDSICRKWTRKYA